MIQRAKQSRVVLLTTHSMEEADALGKYTSNVQVYLIHGSVLTDCLCVQGTRWPSCIRGGCGLLGLHCF
jgi:hypothetical protein